MQKTTARISIRIPALLTTKERLAIARQAAGTWKRPLKNSLRELASIRRGLNRKVGK